jgi:hypothetical protein
MRTKSMISGMAVLRGLLLAGACVVAVPARSSARPLPAPSDACPTCSSSQRCVFDGILNRALGVATTSVTSSCHLLVVGIGSSGLDGFAQDSLPAGAQQIRTLFTGSNLGESLAGAREVVTFHADVPGGVFASMTVEDIGDSTIQITPDFSAIGATRYTVTVMNGAHVTGVFTDLPTATIQTGECVEVEVS